MQTQAVWNDLADNRLMRALALRTRPLVMGVVNLTPDSFHDGGRHAGVEAAVAHALALAAAGADILDLGGESTRPGAVAVAPDEEKARVLPVLEALRARTGLPITIDTRAPGLARAAVAAGADGWNDVSALTHHADSLVVAAGLGVPVVLMHAQGGPETMQDAPSYREPVGEVLGFLVARIGAAVRAGIPRAALIADPGFGFGKTLAHNLALLQGLSRFRALGVPVLAGLSRKRFIAAIDPAATDTADRLGGSIAAALAAAARGAAIIRVHDVAETRQALDVWRAIEEAGA